MQLRPEHVCAAPGTTTTFTCSYRAAENLDIEFSTGTARDTALVAGHVSGDSTARHTWGATRRWTVELAAVPGVKRVTCRVTNVAGVTVGQLHARVYTGATCHVSVQTTLYSTFILYTNVNVILLTYNPVIFLF